MKSEKVSWEWVTADKCVTDKRCELIWAYLVPSTATTDAALYDGQSDAGKQIATLKEAAVTGHSFRPPIPIFCDKGLYVVKGTNATGILVMWRHL